MTRRAQLRIQRLIVLLALAAATPGQAMDFLRGDANLDGRLDIADPDFLSRYLFVPGTPGEISDAMDADDDNNVNIADVVRSLSYLFLNGQAPPAPFPGLGPDPTEDQLPSIAPVPVGSLPITGRLFFEAPETFTAEPGSVLQIPITIVLQTTDEPVTAWSVGVDVEGIDGIISAEELGPAAVGSDFDASHVYSDGLVSAVDLGFISTDELNANGSHSLFQFTIDGTVPAAGVTKFWELAFADERRGPGPPVDTILSVRGRAFQPTMDRLTIEVRGATTEWFWMSDGNGRWDTPQNWPFGDLPGVNDNVSITPRNGLMVQGSDHHQAIAALTIGSEISGRAVLRMGAGSLAATDTVQVLALGEIDLNDSVLAASRVLNEGVIRGSGQLNARLQNDRAGSIRVGAGERFAATGVGRTVNSGRVDVLEGEIEFVAGIANDRSGLISGRQAIMRFGAGLTNDGALRISAGSTDLFGDVSNRSAITLAGAAQVTFYDDVLNAGTIEVMKGAQAVYFGSVSGDGDFPGGGTNVFAGDLRPGTSPGTMEFGGNVSFGDDLVTTIEVGGLAAGQEHDLIRSDGDVNLNGTLVLDLIRDFVPISSDTLTFLEAESLDGAFNNVANAERLDTLGGEGSFLVSYDSISNRVLLSDFRRAGLLGDFDLDGVLDADDIDSLAQAVRNGITDSRYDLTTDGVVDGADQTYWVDVLKSTYFGDANLDLRFDSEDIVDVFIDGRYETNVTAGWAEGDWDGNGRFDSDDFVAAFISGGYLRGVRAGMQAVPEPCIPSYLMVVILVCAIRRPGI